MNKIRHIKGYNKKMKYIITNKIKLYFYRMEKQTTRYFIEKNKMSIRLKRILAENSYPGDVFEYISQINKVQFLRHSGAGQRSWDELEVLLKKNIAT